jgi:hypothetical protein
MVVVYPFQNETRISNRGGSIFLICDQSDLERHPVPVSFWNGYIVVFGLVGFNADCFGGEGR